MSACWESEKAVTGGGKPPSDLSENRPAPFLGAILRFSPRTTRITRKKTAAIPKTWRVDAFTLRVTASQRENLFHLGVIRVIRGAKFGGWGC